MMIMHQDGSITNTAKKFRSIINNHLNVSSDSDSFKSSYTSQEKIGESDAPTDSKIYEANKLIQFPTKSKFNTPSNIRFNILKSVSSVNSELERDDEIYYDEDSSDIRSKKNN